MSLGQTISPELREWVIAQVAAGHSVTSLRASMRDAGWHGDVADAALAEVEAQAAGAAAVEPPRSAFRYEEKSNFGSVHWIEGNYGWALSGPKDRERLKAVASAAYDQLESRPPATQRSSADQLLSRRGS